LAYSSNHTVNHNRRKATWVTVLAVFFGLFFTATSQAQQDVNQAKVELTRPTMQNMLAARLVST